MIRVREVNQIDELAEIRSDWGALLARTPGACFFQSLEWLEVYWRHFGAGQRLRVLLVEDAGRALGILPLVVRTESSRVGRIRVLTFPLHGWGSFYGPITSDPHATLVASLGHLRQTSRDWDLLELRWQSAIGVNPAFTMRAMEEAGCHAFSTVCDHTAVVDLVDSWESYWAARKGAWLRRFRRAEQRLAEHGDISFVHYRPRGSIYDDASPRWDLYDACETVAERSWQGSASNGTTLTHESVRSFLRETHEVAAAMGAIDLNLLLINQEPAAFVYGYHYRGHVSGLRRGYDAECSREGVGNVLLAQTLRECTACGDYLYDMGVGSLETKRYFQTRLLPIVRMSHFPPGGLRTQPLRLARWWQQQRNPMVPISPLGDVQQTSQAAATSDC